MTPTNSAELERQLIDADPAKVAADPQGFGQLVKNYVAASTDAIKGEVAEQVQAGLAEFARETKAAVAPKLAPGAQVPHARGYNPRAAGAKLDEIYADSTDFIRSTWHGNRNPEAIARVNRVRADFSSQYGPDGGFLVPESFRAQLLQTSLEDSVVRGRATVVPMDNPRVLFPTIDVTSHASNVFGGLVGYWTEEGGSLTEAEATFGRVALDAKKLTGYSEVPNELFADSAVSFDALLSSLWPKAIAHFEDVAFFDGSGVGEPLGFNTTSNPSAISVTKETSQAAATILWANIAKMYSRMLPTSINRAVWIANNDTLPQLLQMVVPVKNVAGTENVGGSAISLNGNTAGGAPQLTLLGRPLILTEKASTLGTVGDIVFADLSYYLVGDRQQMLMTNSPHYKFQNDVTAVRIIERVDGRPWLQSAITPVKGSNTLSPFVRLETRS